MAKQTDNKLQVSFSSPSSLDDVGMVLRKGSKEISLTESELSLITEIYNALLGSGTEAEEKESVTSFFDVMEKTFNPLMCTSILRSDMGDDGEDIPEATETESAST